MLVDIDEQKTSCMFKKLSLGPLWGHINAPYYCNSLVLASVVQGDAEIRNKWRPIRDLGERP